MKFINVFANVSLQGKVTVWARGIEYDTRELALKARDIPPDVGFIYIGTVAASKRPTEAHVIA